MRVMSDFLLHRGHLAYLDTFAGLVPCKVLSVDDEGRMTVKVTARRRGYARGEVLAGQRPNLDVLKRTQVVTRRGQFRILGRTVVIPDSGLRS